MGIQFQHANPHSGRESVLLRFDGLLAGQTVCVLVDAGENVSTVDLLDEDEKEYLSAICLTHAHLDHYQSLVEALDHAAPVYAAADTARLLEDVFAVGADHYDLSGTDRVLEQLEPIEAWTQIVSGLRVRPVPAGHAPGAAGFLFEVEDGDERRTILVTGDFTTRRAAGYPDSIPRDPSTSTRSFSQPRRTTTSNRRSPTPSPPSASASGRARPCWRRRAASLGCRSRISSGISPTSGTRRGRSRSPATSPRSTSDSSTTCRTSRRSPTSTIRRPFSRSAV